MGNHGFFHRVPEKSRAIAGKCVLESLNQRQATIWIGIRIAIGIAVVVCIWVAIAAAAVGVS